MVTFIKHHNLWTEAQREAADQIKHLIRDKNLLLIRTAWEDQHGIVRSKSLLPQAFFNALENGMQISTGTYLFDTANALVYEPFLSGGGFELPEMNGLPNLVLAPDPQTFCVLPWAERTGFVLCDQYFKNGAPMPLSSRYIYKKMLAELHQRGFEHIVGLEVEWYLTVLEDPMLAIDDLGGPGSPAKPPKVKAVEHGYQYSMEGHDPAIHELLYHLADNLTKMGLPLRSMEKEWAPGQLEVTFEPLSGLTAADTMMLFRMATKQICRKHGYMASFMCCPALKGFYSNGWHLHQSLKDLATGKNAMMSTDSEKLLSQVGTHFVGGLLAHAAAASVFTTPTINGYKRLRPNSLAPDRAGWGYENRGAMIRVQGAPKDPSTHIENRVGEPSANPYLYMASQIIAGLDGLEHGIDPGPLSENPYADESRAPLPRSLMEALVALKQNSLFQAKMGKAFIDFIVKMKESEVSRFLAAMADRDPQEYLEQVTDWEQQEYFEVF